MCNKCNKIFASSQSLWNHKQRCKERVYPNVPVEDTLDRSEVEDQEEDRVERSAVLSGDIDDLIDKIKNEMDEKIEQLKDDIWHNICEHREFEEKEMQGGSLKPGMGKLWWKEDEDENGNEDEEKETKDMTNTQKKWYKIEKEDKIKNDVFLDVISKSMKKLGEILEDASKETNYEFDDVYELLDKYYNTSYGIQKIITKLKAFQRQYSGEQASFGYDAELVIRAIENLRILINELFEFIRWCDRNLKDHGHVTLKESKQKGCV